MHHDKDDPDMPTSAFRLSFVLAAAALPTIALAQSPPIKPGLWEVRSEGDGTDQRKAQAAERMKNMRPEARAKMEAMMKERGISAEADGTTRVCLSKASLDAGTWQHQASCKTDFGSRTGTSWKWHSVCTQPEVESDGEAFFPNSETYTVKMTSKTKSRTSQRTMNAKWLGASCGDLKPVEPAR